MHTRLVLQKEIQTEMMHWASGISITDLIKNLITGLSGSWQMHRNFCCTLYCQRMPINRFFLGLSKILIKIVVFKPVKTAGYVVILKLIQFILYQSEGFFPLCVISSNEHCKMTIVNEKWSRKRIWLLKFGVVSATGKKNRKMNVSCGIIEFFYLGTFVH